MITGFQFRAAKAALNITLKDIGENITLKEGTLLRFGNTQNLELLRGHKRNLLKLKNLFENLGITFPVEDGVSMINKSQQTPNTHLLTRFQLRTARVATGLTQQQLGFYVKISSSGISLLENLENFEYVESTKLSISFLKKFFERIGIVFPNDLSVYLMKDPKIILQVGK